MLLLSPALAATITVDNSSDYVQACYDLDAGDTLLLDTSGGRFEGKCTVTVADVTIAPVEGQETALVESMWLNTGATRATVRGLHFQSDDQIQLFTTSATDGLAEDIVLSGGIGNGLVVNSYADLEVIGLTASGFEGGAAVVVTSYTAGAAALTLSGAEITESITAIGVYAANEGTSSLDLSDSTLSGNLCQGGETLGLGGGIQANGAATVDVDNVTFEANLADWGGAIGAFQGDERSTMTIHDSTFNSNHADLGAAIYFDYGTLTITDSSFCGNSSSTGSAIVTTQANTTLSRVVFQTQHGNEGVVLLERGVHTHSHLSMVNNRTDVLSIGLGQGAALDLTNSLFVGNGGVFDELYTGGWNAFFDNEGALDVLSGELTTGEAGFVEGYDPDNCEEKPYIRGDSMLVDAGKPGTTDPDGTVADIGAYWAGAEDEGEDAVLESSSEAWFAGGCAQSSVALVFLVGLVGRTRRRAEAHC